MKILLPLSLVAVAASLVVDRATTGVRYLGRVNPSTLELSWPGTGLSFTFSGTSATIGLKSVTGSNSVNLVIDNGPPIVISNVNGSAISTPQLEPGMHHVMLRKRNEAMLGSIFLGEVTTQSGVITPDAAPARQIEVIGDSISVGHGLDGVDPCNNTAAVENNPKTYGALAADSLGADYHVVAVGGRGIVRNFFNDSTILMPQLWTRYGTNDPDNSYPFPPAWNPAAVVINLGTNDFAAIPAVNVTEYTTTTVNFVRTIQGHYSNAQFFLMTSPMLNGTKKLTQTNALKEAVEQIGCNAHLIEWPFQTGPTGCGFHPNGATHAAQATVLASAIKSVLGW